MIDTAKWEISHHCNLKCKHCFVGKVEYEKDLDLESNKKIVDILVKHNVKNVMFSSKEPFAYKNLIDLIKYCRLKNMAISIVTNGTLIKDEHIKELSKCKVNVISMSLEGITAISNDFVRGEGVYDKVMANAQKLKKATGNVKYTIPLALQMSLTTENMNEAPNMHKFFNESPFITVNLGDISLVGNAVDNKRLKLTDEEYDKVIMTFLEDYSKEENPNYMVHLKRSTGYDTIFYNMLFDLSMDIIIPSCSAYFGYYSILPNGDTCGCVALKGLKDADKLNIYSNTNILETEEFVKESRIPKLDDYKKGSFCEECYFKEECTLCLLITTDSDALQDALNKCERGHNLLKTIQQDILSGRLSFKLNKNVSIYVKEGRSYINRLYDGGDKVKLDVTDIEKDIVKIYEEDQYVYMDKQFGEDKAYWIEYLMMHDVLSIDYREFKEREEHYNVRAK